MFYLLWKLSDWKGIVETTLCLTVVREVVTIHFTLTSGRPLFTFGTLVMFTGLRIVNMNLNILVVQGVIHSVTFTL